jgi:methylphosphotriester-DNA--protein-cysteine methyltransferase
MPKTKTLVIAAVALAGLAGAGVAIRHSRRSQSAASTAYRAGHITKVFHQPGCRYYDSRKLLLEFASAAAAAAAGYRPCKLCVA